MSARGKCGVVVWAQRRRWALLPLLLWWVRLLLLLLLLLILLVWLLLWVLLLLPLALCQECLNRCAAVSISDGLPLLRVRHQPCRHCLGVLVPPLLVEPQQLVLVAAWAAVIHEPAEEAAATPKPGGGGAHVGSERSGCCSLVHLLYVRPVTA